MSKNVRIKQYKLINISLLLIFFILWIWLFFNLNQLSVSNLERSEIIFGKLKYISYFLILDVLILSISIVIWFIDTQKKNKISVLLLSGKEKIIKSQQLESEKQKQQLSNITELYNKAIEFDKVKNEFFSNISHELKTPLSVILGAVQLIGKNFSYDSNIIKPEKHYITIRQNCYRLIRLINNILDISKLDSGFVKINPINCNIVYLIEEITQSVTPYAEQKGIQIEFDTNTEEIITGVDIDKIERIILNLLSNSIKFTPPGGRINVLINCANNSVQISIKDSGIGIPVNMQNSIFDRYKQVDSSLIKDYEGSGIGLSLVKSFVELHHGTIYVVSEVNNGSEFIIELPIKLAISNSTDRIEDNKLQSKIIEAINIEFSDIYSIAS